MIQKKYINKKLHRFTHANITVRKNRKIEEFIIRLRHRKHGPIEIVLPKFVRNKLQIKIGDNFEILKIRSVKQPKSPSKLIKRGFVDLLFLLPKKMTTGRNITVDYEKDYIRLWSPKCQEVRIKRFVELDIVGKLFGLIQAESAKKGNKFDFTSILYTIHKEFLSLLSSVTEINDLFFKCYLQYNPRISKPEAVKRALEFQEITDLPSYKLTLVENSQTGDIPPVEIAIFNKLFNEIFLGILENLRSYLMYKRLTDKEKILGESFISRILTGDGTITVFNHKNHFTPYIKIFDIVERLKDYKKILINLGITSRIDEKEFTLWLNCDWETAKYMYKIGAFEGHDLNRKKLLESLINHAKTKSLSKLKIFSNRFLTFDNIAELFSGKSATNYWLANRISEGYLKYNNNKYLLTKKGNDILTFINSLNEKLIK